jgi:hypothetical protein
MVESGVAATPAQDMMELGFASPAWFVMGTTIVEPTFIPRESFKRAARASLAPTRTLTAHEADTHLARRF